MNRSVGRLLGADITTFQLDAPGIEPLYSEEFDWQYLRRYLPTLSDHDPGTPDRMAELGVCNRPMLWGDELEEYYRSAYYNELVVPMRGFDMLSASVRVEGAKLPATLFLHHGSRRGPKFGKRGLRLLRMLYPALGAAVRTFHRFHARRRGLFRFLDSIDEVVLVYDVDGQLLHRSDAYRALGLSDAEDRELSARASDLVRDLAALCRARHARGRANPARAVRTVWGRSRRFELTGSLVEGLGAGRRPLLLISVGERGSASSPLPRQGAPDGRGVPPAIVAEEYGLTPREVEVAGLLTRRLTNREIARRLGISIHTVRHHVEHVLAKLGIHSRREVAEALGGSEDGR